MAPNKTPQLISCQIFSFQDSDYTKKNCLLLPYLERRLSSPRFLFLSKKCLLGFLVAKLFSILHHVSHFRDVASVSLHRMEDSEEQYILQLHQFRLLQRRYVILLSQGQNPSHFLCIALVRKKFHFDTFFQKAAAFCNKIAVACFLDHYELNLLISKVSYYLFLITHSQRLQYYVIIRNFPRLSPTETGCDTISSLVWGVRTDRTRSKFAQHPQPRDRQLWIFYTSQPILRPQTEPRLNRSLREDRQLDNREPDRNSLVFTGRPAEDQMRYTVKFTVGKPSVSTWATGRNLPSASKSGLGYCTGQFFLS